ncbi:hypothetical protein [Paenibacillus harenae]|uniref:hypothetical protein n=1 Tax=Paenibacillus harenae TaxID=306543 RepID=UPI0003F4B982|nr:hypothetical protein [Paenibacillus harenae]
MAKYRKKPVVIEAFRYGIDEWPDWFHDKHIADEIKTFRNSLDRGPFHHSKDIYCKINTLEGTMRGYYGDYIIKGVKDEIYPCKPDIFEATYELVGQDFTDEEWEKALTGKK